ncbi:hypothetical protein [Brevibacillus nitrificans]|uniref:hypothetical protein n=1 Tax=Brevibacillus nitrificans TaxID=651560 RepID=UPI00285C3BB6|nr:hypothetical protein [Brevibacillus nitrificans]MDR7314889.1 hypothetical protein [Brevibacillus nitrificans]
MTYRGVVEYAQQKIMLLLVTILLCTVACILAFFFSFPWRVPVEILCVCLLYYGSLLLSEKKSKAFLSEIEFKVSKGYFFGIIVVNKSYQMEQQYELKEFLEFIERRGIKTFGIPSIDELTNTKITFIREDTAQLK